MREALLSLSRLLLLSPLLLLLVLPGCATVDRKAETVGDKIAEGNDVELKNSERYMCDGASMGAVKRRYAAQPERLADYLRFCQWKTWPQELQ